MKNLVPGPRSNIAASVANENFGSARSDGAMTFADQQWRPPVEREWPLETVAEDAEPPRWSSNANKKNH